MEVEERNVVPQNAPIKTRATKATGKAATEIQLKKLNNKKAKIVEKKQMTKNKKEKLAKGCGGRLVNAVFVTSNPPPMESERGNAVNPPPQKSEYNFSDLDDYSLCMSDSAPVETAPHQTVHADLSIFRGVNSTPNVTAPSSETRDRRTNVDDVSMTNTNLRDASNVVRGKRKNSPARIFVETIVDGESCDGISKKNTARASSNLRPVLHTSTPHSHVRGATNCITRRRKASLCHASVIDNCASINDSESLFPEEVEEELRLNRVGGRTSILHGLLRSEHRKRGTLPYVVDSSSADESVCEFRGGRLETYSNKRSSKRRDVQQGGEHVHFDRVTHERIDSRGNDNVSVIFSDSCFTPLKTNRGTSNISEVGSLNEIREFSRCQRSSDFSHLCKVGSQLSSAGDVFSEGGEVGRTQPLRLCNRANEGESVSGGAPLGASPTSGRSNPSTDAFTDDISSRLRSSRVSPESSYTCLRQAFSSITVSIDHSMLSAQDRRFSVCDTGSLEMRYREGWTGCPEGVENSVEGNQRCPEGADNSVQIVSDVSRDVSHITCMLPHRSL